MILLSTMLIGLGYFSLRIAVEWYASHRRAAVAVYRDHFQRVEYIYPKS